jgi:hypothetical protein
MSFRVLAENRLESGTVTVTSAAAGFGKERLYDRNRGDRWKATSTATQNIDLDGGIKVKASALGLINHNLAGATVEVYRGDSSPAATLITRFVVAGTSGDLYIAWAQFQHRYWRTRILTPAVAPEIGELLLGSVRAVALNPVLRSSGLATIGNVHRDRTRTGVPFAIRLGDKRRALNPEWTALPADGLTQIETAFDDCFQGAKNVLVFPSAGGVRWMSWLDERLDPVPVGNDKYELALHFEDAP